ncbi:MAG: hypothetical protein WCB68_02900 [Pyrinomonadaceae bacterium]
MPSISPATHPLLYRAIKDKRWLKLWSAAFRLRKPSEFRPTPETDLSLIVSDNCTKSVCAAEQRECHGEFVLETQAVLSRASDKGWQLEKNTPNHVSIVGLPLYDSDRQVIEDAATALAELITAVQPRSLRPD